MVAPYQEDVSTSSTKREMKGPFMGASRIISRGGDDMAGAINELWSV